MSADKGLTREEMEAEDATALPDREAMSTLPVIPPVLDLDVNVDAALDIAAPIDAAVAANANAALPIDAAASANVLSRARRPARPPRRRRSSARRLDGEAIATADQTSDIEQGEGDAPRSRRGRTHHPRPDRGGLTHGRCTTRTLLAVRARGRDAPRACPSARRCPRIPPLPGGEALELPAGCWTSTSTSTCPRTPPRRSAPAVAANANVAAPIDAAVAANVASPDATAAAAATQNSTIIQDLDGDGDRRVRPDLGDRAGRGWRRRQPPGTTLRDAGAAWRRRSRS